MANNRCKVAIQAGVRVNGGDGRGLLGIAAIVAAIVAVAADGSL